MSGYQNNSIFWVETEKIVANPFQPRREFEPGALEDLADSIRQYGVLQPLVVTRKEQQNENGGYHVSYELIAGERRLRASRIAGLSQVPVIIRKETDNKVKLELAIIENLQREDLNPIDRALAFEQLYKQFNLTHAEIGKRMGKSRVYVSNSLRLLSLPPEIKQGLISGKITEGHTRPLLMLTDKPEEQNTLYKEIIHKKMSVRDSEKIARKIAQDRVRKKEFIVDPRIRDYEVRLSENLGTRVQIEQGEQGGKITIDYFTLKDLDGILAALQKEARSSEEKNMLDRYIEDQKTSLQKTASLDFLSGAFAENQNHNDELQAPAELINPAVSAKNSFATVAENSDKESFEAISLEKDVSVSGDLPEINSFEEFDKEVKIDNSESENILQEKISFEEVEKKEALVKGVESLTDELAYQQPIVQGMENNFLEKTNPLVDINSYKAETAAIPEKNIQTKDDFSKVMQNIDDLFDLDPEISSEEPISFSVESITRQKSSLGDVLSSSSDQNMTQNQDLLDASNQMARVNAQLASAENAYVEAKGSVLDQENMLQDDFSLENQFTGAPEFSDSQDSVSLSGDEFKEELSLEQKDVYQEDISEDDLHPQTMYPDYIQNTQHGEVVNPDSVHAPAANEEFASADYNHGFAPQVSKGDDVYNQVPHEEQQYQDQGFIQVQQKPKKRGGFFRNLFR